MSSRAWKQSKIVVIAIVLALVFQAIYFKATANYAEAIRRVVKEQGLAFDLSEVRYRFPARLAFSQLGFLAPVARLPFPVFIDRGFIEFHPSQIFGGELATTLTAELYGGSVTTRVGRAISSSLPITFKSEASNLVLANHPFAKTVGLDGIASYSVTGLVSEASLLDKTELTLHLSSLSIGPGQKILGLFKIPAFTNGELIARGAIADGKALLPKVKFESSLGAASGSCASDVSPEFVIQKGNCDFTISLSEIGAREIAPYLQLASSEQSSPTTQEWGLTIRAEKGRIVQVKATPRASDR